MELIETNITSNGTRRVFKAKNGFGASVIDYGYGAEEGLYEVAVLRFNGDDYAITYNTVITGDVVGYLTEEEVAELLKRISRLHRPKVKPQGLLQ